MNQRVQKTLLADGGLLFAAAIWGVNVFLVKDILDSVNPMALTAQRFFLASVVLGMWLLYRAKPLFTQFGHGILLGVLLWGFFVLTMFGIKYTSPINAVFIDELVIVFTPILYLLFWHKKSPLLTWLCVLVAMYGFYHLIGGISTINSGDFLILCAVCVQAVYMIMVSRFMKKSSDPVASCFQQFLVVGVLSAVISLVLQIPLIVHDPNSILLITFMVIFPTIFAFGAQVGAQKYISPVRASLLLSTSPLFAVAWSGFVLHKSLAPDQLVGGLLIVGAVMAASMHFHKTGLVPVKHVKHKR